MFKIAVVVLLVMTTITVFWGWDWAFSTLVGGTLILALGVLTKTALDGVIFADSKKMRRQIWLRILKRLLLLAFPLCAMLFLPWIRFIPLMIGFSLMFPTLIIELVMERMNPLEKKSS
jgi:hypothetical protein